MIRKDMNDLVYRTAPEKYAAVIADIKDCHERGQPVLVGTTSIESSELLSGLLTKEKMPHQVLNAKQHEREAEIIAQAGRPGVITIATNMAGRGTDIVLGGNVEKPIHALRQDDSIDDADRTARIEKLRIEWTALHEKVIAAGGLHIIGTERHESRRIDNQLRGRSGRQGDPGSSRFYLSLEDSLMRIFGGERLNSIMIRLKMPEGEAIEHAMVNRSLESAQRKVEQRNFDIRKQLLEYDDVANDQRRVIYEQRNSLLESGNIAETITAMRHSVLEDTFRQYVPAETVEEQWDLPGAQGALLSEYRIEAPLAEWLAAEPNLADDDLLKRITDLSDEQYAVKVALVGGESFGQFEHNVMLQSLDSHWREHLAALDHLRQGIHLRGYAQKNPKQEYKREAFELFEGLLDSVRADVTRVLMNVEIRSPEQIEQSEPVAPSAENMRFTHAEFDPSMAGEGVDPLAPPAGGNAPAQPSQGGPKIGRNDPCYCGSGKKYKQCHGRLA
jgi:preprotein translocase subunit SecA